jgi:hypothetical protein
VSIQKIAKYAKHFDLVVLYESEESLAFSETAQSLFRSTRFIPLEQINGSLPIQITSIDSMRKLYIV